MTPLHIIAPPSTVTWWLAGVLLWLGATLLAALYAIRTAEDGDE